MESIVESRSQIVSVAGDLFTVFGVHRMVAEGTRSNQKLLALREKGVYSSYTFYYSTYNHETCKITPMQSFEHYIISTLVLFFLISCGGDNKDSVEKEVLNPGLSGSFFISGSSATLMDAVFGDYVDVPNTCYEELPEFYLSTYNYNTYPIQQNGERFIFVARQEGRSYICVQSFSGDIIFDLELPVDVEMASLSQDGAYLALIRSPDDEGQDDLLQIYTTDGVALSSVSITSDYHNLRYVYWLGDNRLVYRTDRSFLITKPALMEIEYQIDLGDFEIFADTERSIGDWAISPDDNRIAFTLNRDLYTTDELQLFVMDLDGSNLTVQVTVTDGGDGSVVFYPLWSPDGQWIFTEVGIQPMIKPYKFTYLYLIPASYTDVPYLINEDDDKRSTEIKKLWRHHYIIGDDEVTSEGLYYNDLYWLP
jgi:hypothetical protein